tara:strand:+ start:3149 stop:3670 length:522 start_codon:yes stop_codon:yes gene_type:complete
MFDLNYEIRINNILPLINDLGKTKILKIKIKNMKQLITILFIGLLSFSVNAQEKVAKIDFKTDTIDYGTIEKGADGVRVFEFTNTGDAPLIVSKVTSSCGCTVPKWSKEPILPGKTGEIQVKYDTNRVNPIRKTITVISNADTPTVALKIKGLVVDSSKENVLEKKDKSIVQQ